MPESWKAQYRNAAGEWAESSPTSAYGVAVDTFNTVTFEPVTTTGLRLVLDAKGTVEGQGSVGIKEWQVHEVAGTPETFEVEVTVTDRCVAGKVILVPTIVNNGDAPVKVVVSSAYGSKTFATSSPAPRCRRRSPRD